MPSLLLPRWLLLIVIIATALALRTHSLADRPMHADEANQAVKLGHLIESGDYTFDPRDHHGPTLYYLALPIAWLRGETTLASLTEITVRLLPALAGTLNVVLLYLLASPPPPAHSRGPRRTPEPASEVGRTVPGEPSPEPANPAPFGETHSPAPSPFNPWLPLCAAAFLAVSPAAVYYSRYFVQETLLVTFTLATFVCVQRWSREPRLGWAIAAGVCIGLMQATKATAPLFLTTGALAWGLARWTLRRQDRTATGAAAKSEDACTVRSKRAAHGGDSARSLGVALVTGLLVAAAFYSSFGTHWPGLRDAVATYTDAAARAASGAGHEKPWWYYLRLLGWHREGGLVWSQLPFTALAFCGAALTFLFHRRPPEECHLIGDTFPARIGFDRALLRWAAVYLALVAVALSAIPYKTPWHLVHLGPPLALLAAGAIAFFAAADRLFPPRSETPAASPAAAANARRFRALLNRIAATLVLAAVLYSLLTQTRLAVFLRPADARNPYAYVHSSPDVLKLRELAETALARAPDAIVRVISEEYWPLPWYFRGLDRVGYWNTPPTECEGALVIASASQAAVVREKLQGRYRESLLGLRPGFLLVVFTPENEPMARVEQPGNGTGVAPVAGVPHRQNVRRPPMLRPNSRARRPCHDSRKTPANA